MRVTTLSVSVLLLFLGGCGQPAGKFESAAMDYVKERIPFPEEVMEYFKSKPEFFKFSDPSEIPENLVWEDGMDLPDIGSPEAKKGGTYHFFAGDFPRTLRFVGPEANGAFRRYILDNNVMLLTQTHPNYPARHFPGLAKSWAISEDRSTVYYKLDPDATYSDGVPVRADDYMYFFYWMHSEWINDPWYANHYTERFESITKFDDLTIAITLPESKPDILYRAAVRAMPMHFYQEFADDFVDYYQWAFEPTTGPYEVKQENIRKGRYVTLTKVENWWAADRKYYRYRFNPDKLHIKVVRSPDKAWELFLKGEIDLYGVSLPEYWYRKLGDDHPRVKNGYIKKATFYNEIPRPTWALRINRSKPLLDNRDIRVGLQYACNWDLVIEKVFKGDYERMQSVADGYSETGNPDVRAREFSVPKAEEAFAKAGFTKRNSEGIFVNDEGKKLSFTITTGYKRVADVLTVLQQEARKAGVDFQIEILELTAAWKKSDEKKHDIALTARNVSPELYPRFREGYHSENAFDENGDVVTDTNNETQTASKELDDMIDRYRASSDLETITELSQKIIQWLHDDAAYIPGWVKPWYRVAYWRWIKWPEDFDVKSSRDFEEYMVFWIDEEEKEETIRAMRKGESFPPAIEVFDKYRLKQ